MIVFLCGEETEEIWCAVYEAGTCGEKADQLRLEPIGCNLELFSQYREVPFDVRNVERVIRTIREKLGEEVYELLYKVTLSQERYRADLIYRFLQCAFRIGPKVVDMLKLPPVFDVFRVDRNVFIEYHHLRGFARFSMMEDGILLGKIAPKNDVTVLLAAHFAERMSGENWILYDINRKKAAVHQAGSGWVMVRTGSEDWQKRLSRHTDEETFEQLWKTFHKSVSIQERENKRCQLNMLPLRFRPYMTEFQQKKS